MNCNRCGFPLQEGQTFCPRCGMELYQPQGAPVQPPRPKRKTSTVVVTMLLIFLSVAVVIGTAAFILTHVWSHSLTSADAFSEYKEIIAAARDDIERAEEDGIQPIALYDVNKSGIDDMVYVKKDSDGNQTINYVTDQNGKVREYTLEDDENMVLFVRESDGSVYEYVKSGDTETYYRISPEDGSRVETYSRTYHSDTNEYEYTYSNTTGEEPSDSAGTLYENFVSDLEDEDVTILYDSTDEDEDENKLPSKNTNLATVSFDDARDRIDRVINDAKEEEEDHEEDEKVATPDETAAPTERSAEKIDVSAIPEQKSLKNFLNYFYGYRVMKNGSPSYVYDSSKPDNALVDKIVTDVTCVPYSTYPGDDYKRYAGSKDSKGRFDNGYILMEKSKVLWIMDNILNISEDKAKSMISAVSSGSDSAYEVTKNGKTYLCGPISGKGGLDYTIEFRSAKYDGEKYYITYDLYPKGSEGNSSERASRYVEMSLKEINGKKYWSLYRYTDDVPSSQKSTGSKKSGSSSKPSATEAPEASFDEIANEYYFSSGAGAWGTIMNISSDGSFYGTFSDQNMAFGSDEYSIELLYSEFSGQFTNLKKVNDYTYSFELQTIDYTYEPGTEEITDRINGTTALVKYWTAYGLDEGTDLIYFYTADAPWDELPDDFQMWVSNSRYNYSGDDLGRNCLYCVEPGYGWTSAE